MVNLISRASPRSSFSALDAEAWETLVSRARGCAAFCEPAARTAFQRHAEALASEIEELEHAPTPMNASAVVEAIDQLRVEWIEGTSSRMRTLGSSSPFGMEFASEPYSGDLVCYYPGRSLSTGEAEVASRGYFDVLDRPPLWSWVSVVGRRVDDDRSDFEVGILAWVAPEDEARARAGCEASAVPAVTPLEKVSEAIMAQWQASWNAGETDPP